MSVQTYNTIELRYASSELAKNQFVREVDFQELEERVAILMLERTHWHNMYNAASAPDNESVRGNEMLGQ